ncbi:uncharacterized protein PRCAT00003326001 [Priceomyces carsonii]|uniref:uncharacterized protein n=1 Tax=Priceomyces carsonii TaxID=28549 RepID=UPI002EDB1622|nr:unnamed protein product [Priceomyces carsonii]
MELLPDGQSNTASEVSWEDQQKINKFSTLINKKDEELGNLEKLRTEKSYIDDMSLELELLDEDEKIQYKVGEIFVFMKVKSVIERIEKENENLDVQIKEIDDDVEDMDEKLDELKKQLYEKFGKNINLER